MLTLQSGGSLTQACRAHPRGLPLTSWQPVMGVPSLVVAVGCMGGTYLLESSTAQFWGPSSSLSLSFPSVKWGCSLTGLCEGWMRSCLCAAGLMALHTVGAHQSALLVQSGLGVQAPPWVPQEQLVCISSKRTAIQSPQAAPPHPSPLSPPHRFLSITPLPTWLTGI